MSKGMKVTICLVLCGVFGLGYLYRGDTLKLRFGNEVFANIKYDTEVNEPNDAAGIELEWSWPEPSLENPMDVIIYGNSGRECEFKVTGPNEIECSCSFGEFVRVMYSAMTGVDSNDVRLEFMSICREEE